MNKADLAIVVPAYNEAERFPLQEFQQFLNTHEKVRICLVNDASTDLSAAIFSDLAAQFPGQVSVLQNDMNSGKAESVRRGVLHCYQQQAAKAIAYLDADLATSLEECYGFCSYLEKKDFVFASRILRVGSVVERKFSRFLIGRVLATAISNILDLKVYDTQCGCKVFKAELAPLLFEGKFISKWLFDVELFSRMLNHFGHEEAIRRMEEIPVTKWVDKGASKVALSYFFRLWYDLWLIRHQHKRGGKAGAEVL